jgi:hypothetical protein
MEPNEKAAQTFMWCPEIIVVDAFASSLRLNSALERREKSAWMFLGHSVVVIAVVAGFRDLGGSRSHLSRIASPVPALACQILDRIQAPIDRQLVPLKCVRRSRSLLLETHTDGPSTTSSE